jgi:hypothetical protein
MFQTEEFDMNVMQDWKTLTGMTLGQAITKLAEVLPPEAYKKVPGAADLTDIDPAYLTETVTKVFGPCGLGWTFSYNPADLEVRYAERTTRKGDTYAVYEATLARLDLRYCCLDGENRPTWSEPILANGGSDNEQKGFAVRGALTNAIGAAFSKLCWQILVYKGVVSHDNAATVYKKQAEKRGEAPPEGQPAPAATVTVPQPVTMPGNGNGHHKPAPATPSSNGHKPGSNGSAPAAQPAPAATAEAVAEANPGDFLVPMGKNAGKKLSEVDEAWVKWAAKDMKPTNEQTRLLQAAALAFLSQHGQP